jgi:hypothetical protein
MHLAAVHKIVSDSVARGSSTPCPWEKDRDAYIERKAAELLKLLMEPMPATVIGRNYDYEAKGLAPYAGALAIARIEDHWLLYLQSTGEFALAFGKSPSNLNALGYESTDALAEWLG